MSPEPLRLYWSASKPNVGDWLSPLIVQSYTSRQVVHAPAKRCDMMSIGSVLQKAKNHFWSPSLDIWGSGFMHAGGPTKLKHRVHAVRGKLTRQRLVGCQDIVCGDPGLLLPRIMGDYATDQRPVTVGVVPHYWDRENVQVKRFIESFPGAKFIDIFSKVEDFVREVNQCECILSSSLHGLVIADAYGIPNQWLVLSDKVEGNNFKFRDYYSVFDMPTPEFMQLETIDAATIETIVSSYTRPGLNSVVDRLSASFPETWK
ncbi:MAG: polysaccharide pyruvyl transferase family protein [Halioglobus sp.]